MDKQTARKHKRNLKIMEKLKYGKDYTDIFSIVQLISIMAVLFFGGLGLILFSLFFSYLAAVQLYSGIALNFLQWEWKWNWERRLVARYTKIRQPDLFYLSIVICIIAGLIFLFLSVLWIRHLLNS